MRRSTVLIVGAGPCGTMMACELRRRGIDTTLVESSEERRGGSRAILLWPPTLELFEGAGIRAEVERRGVMVQALMYHVGRPLRLPLDPVDRPVILPQEDTSHILESELERLGGKVERGLTVTGLDQDAEGVAATVRRSDGTEERLEADWLIGADGFRSVVRESLGVEYGGAPLPVTFLLAEGTITGDYDPEAISYYLARTGVILVAPLPGGRVRISGAIEDDTEVTEESVQRLLDERGPGGLRVGHLTMNTTFTSHERIAERFRSGRCFLIGDAAHSHSVVGGQGLNLGMADARNLAWKLAAVIRGGLAPSILDTYEVERKAAAGQIVKATSRMTRRAVLSPLGNRLRNAVITLAYRSGVLEKTLPALLAGRRIQYPEALLGATGSRPPYLPSPGTRDPKWRNLDDQDRFELVTVGDPKGPLHTGAAAIKSDIIVHRHLRANKDGFIVLRPDGFVAAAGREPDLEAAMHALDALEEKK